MKRWAFGLMTVAALAGVAGLMQAASAAHGTPDPLLQTSANFLLIMATAIVGIVAVALANPDQPIRFLVAGSLLCVGCLLFCGDLTARVFWAQRLFPFAAPAGGTLMILGWLTAAFAAISAFLTVPRRD